MMESSSNTAAASVDKGEANGRHRLDKNLNGDLRFAEILQECLSIIREIRGRSSVPTNHRDGFPGLYTNSDGETILTDCIQYLTRSGEVVDMTPAKRQELDELILTMANFRFCSCLTHIDHDSVSELDEGDKTDTSVVYIGDPLHSNPKGHIAHCVRVMVRPVTCDSMNTTGAITKECGDALEGRAFRAMSPAQLDEEGKDLHGKNDTSGLFPGSHKDLLLHGNSQGWDVGNKAGEAVGDTVGGSTNDAPSPKGADVRLRIGITDSSHETLSAAKTVEITGLPRRMKGSDELAKDVLGRSEEKVAHDAFDRIVLDNKVTSIVRAMISRHLTCRSWTVPEPHHEEDYRHHSIMSNPFGFDMVFNKLTLFKDLHNHPLFIGVFMAVLETVRRSPAKIGGHSMPVLIVLLLFASVGDVMANGTGVDSDGGDTGDVHVCKGDFCVTAKVAILVPLGTALLVAGGFCWRRALACCSCCCRLWCWPSATEGNIMTDSPPQQQADAQPLMQTQVSNLVTLVRILFVAFVTMLTGTRRVAPVSRAPSVGGVSLV